MNLGYLGPKGTFSYEAALKIKEKNELVEYHTITEIIKALENGKISQAIVPIENSIQGGVTETIDALINTTKVYVNKEITLKIVHNLMANKNYKLNEIKEIYSHPQALAQCRNYIENYLPEAQVISVPSTAYAAEMISNKDACACVANLSCLKEYHLYLLDKEIQDNELNKTKFWILSNQNKKQGNKISLIFSTNDKPGDLYKVLEIFYKNGINLTKIESRPAKTKLGAYIFLVDLEVNDNINQTLDLLQKECSYLKNLGRYEKMKEE